MANIISYEDTSHALNYIKQNSTLNASAIAYKVHRKNTLIFIALMVCLLAQVALIAYAIKILPLRHWEELLSLLAQVQYAALAVAFAVSLAVPLGIAYYIKQVKIAKTYSRVQELYHSGVTHYTLNNLYSNNRAQVLKDVSNTIKLTFSRNHDGKDPDINKAFTQAELLQEQWEKILITLENHITKPLELFTVEDMTDNHYWKFLERLHAQAPSVDKELKTFDIQATAFAESYKVVVKKFKETQPATLHATNPSTKTAHT